MTLQNALLAGEDKKLLKRFKLIKPRLTIMNLGMLSFFVFLCCDGGTFAASSPQRSASGDISWNRKQRDDLKAITFIKLVTLYCLNVCGKPLRFSCCSFFHHFWTGFGITTEKVIKSNAAPSHTVISSDFVEKYHSPYVIVCFFFFFCRSCVLPLRPRRSCIRSC